MRSRSLAHILALLALCYAATISSESQLQADEDGEKDERISKAERVAREGLLAGIAGDAESRDTVLRRVLSIDPNCGLARWHLGQIRVGEEWLTVAQAEERMAEDGLHIEYRHLRDAASENPRLELGLADWCLRHGLHDAQQLHLRRVLASAAAGSSEHKQAADALDLRMYGGALLPAVQIEQLKSQLAEERKQHTKWQPLLQRWRKAIVGKPGRNRSYALKKLRAIDDAAVIPLLESLLSPHSEELAIEVVHLLGNMPEFEATESLVHHAVDSNWNSVRNEALQRLQQRPLHDFVPLLVRQLVPPVESKFYVNVGADGLVRRQHIIFREGLQERHMLIGNYVGGPQFFHTGNIWIQGARRPGAAGKAGREALANYKAEQLEKLRRAAAIRRIVLLQESVRAIRTERDVANANAAIARHNQRLFEILARTTGQVLARSPVGWWEWWMDYNEVYRPQKQTYTHQVGRVDPQYIPWRTVTLMSCFPAGTQVRSSSGLIDIMKVRPGDRVLSQNIETGGLEHKLVLQTTVRPPSELLRITLDDAAITTTKGHPFFVNNVGWRMAKRLHVGQQIQCVGGGQVIRRIEPAAAAEAYNLVVADFGTYFVGDPGVLVHDNTYRKATTALTPGLLAQQAAAIAGYSTVP